MKKKFLKDMTFKERVQHYADNSELNVIFQPQKYVGFRFRGELAKVPSMKNSKQILRFKRKGGRGKELTAIGLSLVARAKLKAMDALFSAKGLNIERLRFPESMGDLAVWIELAQGNTGDAIGAAETILDWLEPSGKLIAKKRRGWGIGLYQDDDRAIPIPIHSRTLTEHGSTYIFIRPFSVLESSYSEIRNRMLFLGAE